MLGAIFNRPTIERCPVKDNRKFDVALPSNCKLRAQRDVMPLQYFMRVRKSIT